MSNSSTPGSQALRVLLAGLGVRGSHWQEAMAASGSAALVGVVEPKPRADIGEPVFDDLSQALSLEPDALIVATPPETHFAIVKMALEAGIPVLCEKPLSEDVVEAQAMSAIARDTGTTLLVGMNFRFVPSVIELRRIVEDRRLGEPMFSQFTYVRNRDGRRTDLNDYPLTMADPMLVEQSIHHLDLLRHVYRREPVTVSAHTWNPSSSTYLGDAAVVATVIMEGDLVVSYLGTWASGTNAFDYRWRTDFERGVAIQTGQFGGLQVSELEAGRALTGPLYDTLGERLESMRLGPVEPFVHDTRDLLRHFIAAVRGVEDPGPTAHDHLSTLRLVDAIRVSSYERRVVNLA